MKTRAVLIFVDLFSCPSACGGAVC